MIFSHGWLADSSVRYPMQKAVGGCGNKKGIIGSPLPREDKENTRSTECALL